MKVGFFAPHVGEGASTEAIDRACAIVEEYNADSIWAVDHIAFPYGYDAVYPYALHQFGGPDTPPEWWDCLSVLAYLAARTQRVQIGTGVLILPYRHPVATAKAIATVDQLSHGRVLFGVGVGWLSDEFEALQLKDFKDRGTVTDEQLQVIKALWQHHRPSFDGKHYKFPPISVTPSPAQRPHPPILVGGNSVPALRRTVTYGDGWHALMLTPGELAEHISRLHAMAAEAGRTEPIAISALQPVKITKDPSIFPSLDLAHRQQAMVGTIGQLVNQLKAYQDTGLEHLHTVVSTDSTIPTTDAVGAMELFMREVWPAYLA
jgi:probable F420-dependent oxidoreductase